MTILVPYPGIASSAGHRNQSVDKPLPASITPHALSTIVERTNAAHLICNFAAAGLSADRQHHDDVYGYCKALSCDAPLLTSCLVTAVKRECSSMHALFISVRG